MLTGYFRWMSGVFFLYDVNSVDEIMIATRHTNMAVRKGDKLAGMRVIPLVIDEKKLEEAEKAAGKEPLLKVTPGN